MESYCKTCIHYKKNNCSLKSHYPDTYGKFARGGIMVVREGYGHAKVQKCTDYGKKVAK